MYACIIRETFVFTVFRRVFHSILKLELCWHACWRRDQIIPTCRCGKNMPTTALVFTANLFVMDGHFDLFSWRNTTHIILSKLFIHCFYSVEYYCHFSGTSCKINEDKHITSAIKRLHKNTVNIISYWGVLFLLTFWNITKSLVSSIKCPKKRKIFSCWKMPLGFTQKSWKLKLNLQKHDNLG